MIDLKKFRGSLRELQEALETELRARRGGFFLHVFLSAASREELEEKKQMVDEAIQKACANVEEMEQMITMRGPSHSA